jgi:hypothetical protein
LVRGHETNDSFHAHHLEFRGGVDEDERVDYASVRLACGDQPSDATHRCPYDRWQRVEGSCHSEKVRYEGIQPVVGVGRPVALAVAPSVEGDSMEAGASKCLGGATPRPPGLPSAVEQEHWWRAWVAPRVTGEAHTVEAAKRNGSAHAGNDTSDVTPTSHPSQYLVDEVEDRGHT